MATAHADAAAAGVSTELGMAEKATRAGAQLQASLDFIQASTAAAIAGPVVGSALAGSLCVGVLTPQRNAMTLAAKDTTSTYITLYGQVFSRGLFGGFRGGSWPVVMALPQFACIGPVYHATKDATGSALFATSSAALAESAFTYGAQARNAQIQFNASRGAAEQIQVMRLSFWPGGPGFGFHVLRNALAMMGIRIFSPYSLVAVKQLPWGLNRETQAVLADLSSSIAAATLSMPFNHVFSWAACTPELKQLSAKDRMRAGLMFLYKTYSEQGVRLFARDMAVRWSYTANLFTLYHALERRVLAH